MAANSITVRVLADIDDLKKKLDSVETSINKVDDSVQKQSNGLKKVGEVAAGAFAASKIIDFGDQLLAAGRQADTFGKKAATVFEDQVSDMSKWADANNEAFGVTDKQLVGMAANMADLLKPMGFTSKEAGSMSKEMVGLSGALSAWSNGTRSSAEVADILQKALLGERDGLKGLGISISEADVQARLAKNGTKDLTGAALEQAKAIATQQLIMEKSTDAQKAWSDGTFAGVKKSNELKAKLDEMKEAMGERLLPIVQGVTSFFVDKMIPAIESLSKWVGDHKEILLSLALGIVAALVPAFIGWATSAGAAAVATLAAAAPVIAVGVAVAALAAGVVWAYQNVDIFRETVDAIVRFFRDKFIPVLGEIVGWIGDKITAAIDFAAGVFNAFKGLIDRFGDDVVKIFEFIGRAITAPWKVAFNAIAIAWNATVGRLSFEIPGWVPGLGGKGFDMPNLPTVALAEGGVVMSPTVALLGEAGPEVVIPLNGRVGQSVAGSGSGISIGAINVHALSADPRSISDAVVEALRDYAYRNGPIRGVAS